MMSFQFLPVNNHLAYTYVNENQLSAMRTVLLSNLMDVNQTEWLDKRLQAYTGCRPALNLIPIESTDDLANWLPFMNVNLRKWWFVRELGRCVFGEHNQLQLLRDYIRMCNTNNDFSRLQQELATDVNIDFVNALAECILNRWAIKYMYSSAVGTGVVYIENVKHPKNSLVYTSRNPLTTEQRIIIEHQQQITFKDVHVYFRYEESKKITLLGVYRNEFVPNTIEMEDNDDVASIGVLSQAELDQSVIDALTFNFVEDSWEFDEDL